MKKKEVKFTLKELLSSEDTNSIGVAFGIKEKRGVEISNKLDDVFKTLNMKSTWSAKEMLVETALQNIAKTAREVALVAYLIGCRVGENTVAQDLVTAMSGLKLPKKEDDGYVN